MTILLNVLVCVFIPLLVLFAILFLLGIRATKRLKTRFPPPGRTFVVEDGGRRIHLHATGCTDSTLSRTVVLEAGRGDFSLTWADVQTELSRSTRVVSYDRAGLGWSDRSNRTRSMELILEDLHCALRISGEKPPFVLVGHSIGGLYVRLFAQRYPEEVAGLVLVDPPHEYWMRDFGRWILFLDGLNDVMLLGMIHLMQILNLMGLLPILADSCKLRSPIPAPAQVRDACASVFYRNLKHTRACVNEIKNTNAQFAEARIPGGLVSLGNVPLRVIAASPVPVPEGCWSCCARYVERCNAKRTKQLGELVALSSQGQLVVAEESGHYVHLDRPSIVLDAIKEVMARDSTRKTS